MNPLASVLTITEAAQLYHVGRSTIRYHMNRGNLDFRKTDKTYLITTDSLINLWGLPQNSRYVSTKTSV